MEVMSLGQLQELTSVRADELRSGDRIVTRRTANVVRCVSVGYPVQDGRVRVSLLGGYYRSYAPDALLWVQRAA